MGAARQEVWWDMRLESSKQVPRHQKKPISHVKSLHFILRTVGWADCDTSLKVHPGYGLENGKVGSKKRDDETSQMDVTGMEASEGGDRDCGDGSGWDESGTQDRARWVWGLIG